MYIIDSRILDTLPLFYPTKISKKRLCYYHYKQIIRRVIDRVHLTTTIYLTNLYAIFHAWIALM